MTDDAQHIRRLRMTIGWTMKELAERSGVSWQTIAKAERGEHVTGASRERILGTLESMAEECGIDLPNDTPLDLVIFGVLADYTSDVEWIDEVSAKLATALRESKLLR